VWRWMAAAGLAALTLSAGCMRHAKRANAGAANADQPGVPVEVSPARLETMADRVTVTGTIRALKQADVAAQISGRVTSVLVREGDTVREGQTLVTLDRAQAESQARQARAAVEAARAALAAAQSQLKIVQEGARAEERAIARSRLEQAEAALRTSQADLERLKGLFAQGAVSRQQLDAAQMTYDTARTNRDSARQSLELIEKGARPEELEASRKQAEAAAANLKQAQAALASAEEMLGYTVIRAPISGVVYERNVDPGEIASTMGGAPLLRIADYSAVYYEATVPERVALRVRPGQRVEVTVQADGQAPLAGTVERVVPVANPSSREFLLRITLADAAGVTKPGMFARGLVVVQERPDAVVIPKEAVVEREGRSVVFVVSGGKAEMRPVKVGLSDETRSEIVSGLRAGESVVVVGAQGLQDGDRVQVRDPGGT